MKKVLLLGDSIRLGYCRYVKYAFKDVAQIYYPTENCRFTTYVIRNLHEWKKQTECGSDIDLIHWNVGLWDCLRQTDGEVLISLDEYRRNLERICRMIQSHFPKAKMIFATSTPVQEALYTGEFKRLNRDVEAYNAVAVEVITSFGGEIDDLYTHMTGIPTEYYSDKTHFNTKEGTRHITAAVVQSIEKALDLTSSPVDYDAVYGNIESVLGF